MATKNFTGLGTSYTQAENNANRQADQFIEDGNGNRVEHHPRTTINKWKISASYYFEIQINYSQYP